MLLPPNALSDALVFLEIILASASPHRIAASWWINPSITEVPFELRKAWIKGALKDFHG